MSGQVLGYTDFRCPRCGDFSASALHILLQHMSACTAEPLRAPVVARAGGPYSELRRVLDLAFDQASVGKGKERHATGDERFEDQQIVQLGAWMGSTHFEIGQACKKLLESTRLKPGAAKREILGSINYACAAYVLLEHQEAQETVLRGPQKSEG